MPRSKKKRIDSVALLDRVVAEPAKYRGHWAADFFGNNHPSTLELGCGKGDYAIALAQMLPKLNFIGIDIKGARLFRAATIAESLKLNNVVFFRADIRSLRDIFAENEIAEIWLTFPDPFPKTPHIKRRLLHPSFLEIYKMIMKPHGLIHLKTDNWILYDYTLESVISSGGKIHTANDNLYAAEIADPILSIQTTYEKRHLASGATIHYICFSL
jgi:tRNA (guanine-N7-)-methyltransferase